MELTISNLSFGYHRKYDYVLNDVNLTFKEGGVIGLLGPNGAGKSTLLYLISGALRPKVGDITLNGISTSKREPAVLADIFLVPEEAQLPAMNLESYMRLYSVFYPHFEPEIMKTALKEFGMEALFEAKKKHKLNALSMGQKKKVLLSFAFACQSPITLLDEPTNGLDIPGKAAFRRIISRLATDDKLFIISTHQVRDLDTILDHVLIMNLDQFLINESINTIQNRLRFVSGADKLPEDAFYSTPTPLGFEYIAPNHNNEDTQVNLENLFDAALKYPELLKSFFN